MASMATESELHSGPNRGGTDLDQVGSQTEPPTKTPRTNKACVQCRVRKQRCHGQSRNDPTASCSRCIRSRVTCSFTTTLADGLDDSQATAMLKVTRQVNKLHDRSIEQEKRIDRLETLSKRLETSDIASPTIAGAGVAVAEIVTTRDSDREHPRNFLSNSNEIPGQQDIQASRYMEFVASPAAPARTVDDHDRGLETVDLGTPMSTLRNLQQNPNDMDQHRGMEDPVSLGLMTMAEAQEAFDFFFSSCHLWAPVLCTRIHRSATAVRTSCPTLFTSICAVALRFLSGSSPVNARYSRVVECLDRLLGRLLLKPRPSDVSLNHVRALLLYVQWMPVDAQGTSGGHTGTRYNDVSAWSMLGLVIRYSLFLGLQDSAMAFTAEREASATVADAGRLRVWINVLTCDANLMLSSGLPASLNPEPVAIATPVFASHSQVSQPSDIRVAGLCELVAILKRVSRYSGKPNVRALDPVSLRRANVEFDIWESQWTQKLGPDLMHNQMPFTALRAYRLAVNTSCLSDMLSRRHLLTSTTPLPHLHSIQALDVALGAASQTFVALSTQATWQTWSTWSNHTSIPPGPLLADRTAVHCISFSVDSTWVSHCFAAVFLVLCYTRRAIDDDLHILAIVGSSQSSDRAQYPSAMRPTSLLSRLITLAVEIFDIICNSSEPNAHHPAAGYRRVLRGQLLQLTHEKAESRLQSTHVFDSDLENLFDSVASNYGFDL